MSERPGEHEPGYPTAPAPRPEPYTVDDETPRSVEDGGEVQAWRPGPATPHSDVPAPPPWRVPTRDTATDDAARAAGPTAAEDAPDTPSSREQQGAWPPAGPGDAPEREPGAETQQGPDPQRGHEQQYGSGRQHDAEPHPVWGLQGAGGYPPADPPPEFVTSGTAAASSADTRFAWHSPAAGRPWQADPPTAATASPRRRRVGLGVVVLLVLVALLSGIVLGALGARWLWPEAPGSALPEPSGTSATTTARAPESVAGIAAAALQSTVYIEVRGGSGASSGSGMVLREDGYLVTNNHVIAPAAGGNGRVTVTFADGHQEDAEIVGRTADYDLAVLKVAETGLTPLSLADSDAVVVGDTAVAVGAPLGLEGTVTTGIVSALNRPVEAGGSGDTTSFINAIQTDAAINPGNSGGPLLNGAGEVIGINTAIAQAAGQQTGSIGLGFAIPSNQVRRTAEQIIQTGQATYPVIGVALDTRYNGEGVLVLEEDAADSPAVTPGGPGDAAGIEPGDVITHFDGQPVTSPSELIVAVRSRAPGDTVVLTVRSDGGSAREVEVVLDEAGSS